MTVFVSTLTPSNPVLGVTLPDMLLCARTSAYANPCLSIVMSSSAMVIRDHVRSLKLFLCTSEGAHASANRLSTYCERRSRPYNLSCSCFSTLPVLFLYCLRTIKFLQLSVSARVHLYLVFRAVLALFFAFLEMLWLLQLRQPK